MGSVIPRLYTDRLLDALQRFPCVALLGPRQCGKTTLLGALPSGWRRLDLERLADHDEVARDPDLFFRLHPEQIAIDEVQVAPRIFPALRVAVDAARGRPGRYVLTGSSSPELVRGISESLAGRVALIEMAPLSLAEAYRLPLSPLFEGLRDRASVDDLAAALVPRLDARQVHDWWFRGGFPEPWTRDDPVFAADWTEQHVATYVYRDVARLFPGLNRERYVQFVRLLAGISGSVVNHSEVARALGVSQPTVRDWFDIAHGTFLWRRLPAFSPRDPMKRLVKAPRGHLRDSGLLHHLLRIPDARALASHPRLGASWEGAVVEEVLRGLHQAGVGCDTWHYRTAAGAEVDLVIEGSFGLVPIEVKHATVVARRDLRALRDFVDQQGCPYGLVLSNDDRVRRLDERLLGVPAGAL